MGERRSRIEVLIKCCVRVTGTGMFSQRNALSSDVRREQARVGVGGRGGGTSCYFTKGDQAAYSGVSTKMKVGGHVTMRWAS